ncbi:MAG: hypothetical protein IJ518_03615 [Clostridia bacterium]|nr:hypothetical protein [Clostridia bacterium]
MAKSVWHRLVALGTAAVMLLTVCAGCTGEDKPDSDVESTDNRTDYSKYIEVSVEQFSKNRGEWDVDSILLSNIFTDGVVLQREQGIRVFGEAPNGQPVTVALGEDTVTVTADAENGGFIATLPPRKAATGLTLTVTSGEETVTVKDVCVGDVFLCGGQSNMQLTMDDTEWYGDFYLSQFKDYQDDPLLRQYLVEFGASTTPQLDSISVGWVEAKAETFKKFAPLAYLFACQLRQREGDIPVGLVMCSAGGSAIQLWMPEADQVSDGDSDSQFYSQRAQLYNNMVAPLMPYTVSAVLWYQGCANATYDKEGVYELLLERLISSWRRELYSDTVPFYVIELAGWNDRRFVTLRQNQRTVSDKLDNVFLIANYDLGHPSNIHPTTKDVLAVRLANAYRATRWYEACEWQAPRLDTVAVADGKATVTFTYVYDGLKEEQALNGFAVCDENGAWYDAQATVSGKDTVTVWCDEVATPTGVKYAQLGYLADVNAYNSADLPVLPFIWQEEK